MIEQLLRHVETLPDLLSAAEEPNWNSLNINYHDPHVERLWRQVDADHRLLLHCIHPCVEEDALLHPHPWPSAVLVLPDSGRYLHLVGHSSGVEKPEVTMRSIATVGSCGHGEYVYEMTNPDAWHAVVPLDGPVYTVMLIGPRWGRAIPEVTSRAANTLKTLSDQRKGVLLSEFSARMLRRQMPGMF